MGHRIIEINGQSVVAMPHARIIELLTEAHTEVRGLGVQCPGALPPAHSCSEPPPLYCSPRSTSRRCRPPPTACSQARSSLYTCDRHPRHHCALAPSGPGLHPWCLLGCSRRRRTLGSILFSGVKIKCLLNVQSLRSGSGVEREKAGPDSCLVLTGSHQKPVL